MPHVNFYDPIFWDDLNKGRRGEAQRRKIEDFFRLLAVCHSVTPEKDEKTHEVRLRHRPHIEKGREGGRNGGRRGKGGQWRYADSPHKVAWPRL